MTSAADRCPAPIRRLSCARARLISFAPSSASSRSGRGTILAVGVMRVSLGPALPCAQAGAVCEQRPVRRPRRRTRSRPTGYVRSGSPDPIASRVTAWPTTVRRAGRYATRPVTARLHSPIRTLRARFFGRPRRRSPRNDLHRPLARTTRDRDRRRPPAARRPALGRCVSTRRPPPGHREPSRLRRGWRRCCSLTMRASARRGRIASS
jgi:hypothetical protein